MKPNFALDLSHEGITLLHHSAGGQWTEVGKVALDDPALRETLSYLRSTAVGLEGKGFGTKIILPNSQILYREIHAPGPGDTERKAQILAALDGATPYDMADLTFDWVRRGAFVQVAVVANETLDEAEGFAVEHRFNPISFTSRETDAPDAWQPFFGRTDYSYAFLGADADVRDTVAPDSPAEDAENLFSATGATPEPATTQSAVAAPTAENTVRKQPPEASFFADDAGDIAAGNIFAPETAETPPAPPAGAEDPPIPAFSSRRKTDVGGDQSAGTNVPDRPISRVEPRIAIAPAGAPAGAPESSDSENTVPENPAPEIAATVAPPPAGGDNLRATILGQDTPPPTLGQRFKALAAALAARFGGGVNKASSVSLTLARNAAGSASTRAKALRDRRRAAKPAPPPRSEPTISAPKAQSDDNTAKPPDPDAAKTKRRRIIISSAAVLLLAVVVGAYAALGPLRGTDDSARDNGNADENLTTASARGVRAENRPRERPSDLGAVVSAINPPTKPIRPARRSVFEGRTDPQANLPDTATPVTALSEQELADIRAAGLPAPTREEMAEGGASGQDGQMTAQEVAAAYAATGALQALQTPPSPLKNPERDDIFVAGIDRALEANDAIILPDFNGGVGDSAPHRMSSPLGADVTFSVDANGLVVPTAEGALTPDGVLVRKGKPPIQPPTKPEVAQLIPPDPLAARKPKARPADLKTGEDAIFIQGKMTIAQLRARRAKPRPASVQELAAQSASTGASASELAVMKSLKPSRRPSDFSKIVEKAQIRLASATPATAPIVRNDGAPRLPTRASVAKRATIRNAINLSRLNLIGVYGTPAKRSALLRLPSGRFVKVKIGDRVDGGKVAAIGTSSLSYVKSGRNRVLKIPN